jgi:hypothetical protein
MPGRLYMRLDTEGTARIVMRRHRKARSHSSAADRVEVDTTRSMARDDARAVCALCNHELWTEGMEAREGHPSRRVT